MRVRLEFSLRAFSIMKKCTSAEFSNDINVDDRRQSEAGGSRAQTTTTVAKEMGKSKVWKVDVEVEKAN